VGASWYNNTAGASFSQPLTRLPQTTAFLRALALPGQSGVPQPKPVPKPVPKRYTTITSLMQHGSPDIVRAHLTYGTTTTYGTTPVYLGLVTLWAHGSSSSTWVAVGSAKTDANGWAYLAVRPTAWTAYRWTFAGAASLYGTTSLTVTT
jgi:hypothetical protein